jgi:3-hydroxy-9,10-secoandrosta-1,3,5(10)-triene-9,17-dione monooxygenase
MSTTPTQSIPVPEPGLTQEEMVQRARGMIGVLRERQEECERIGRLPDETSREFVEAGFYRILQPRRFGGYEFDLPTFTRVAIALARGCPASGWTYTLTAGHAHMLAALWSEEGQIDIYGADGEVRMPGRFRPGTATPVDGGYRVSGTWDYVSGCDSATHLAFGFMLGDDPSAGELATDFIGVVDYADCEIIDNWDVLGLRGTGSKRVVVEDVFVPEHRTIDSIFKLDAPPAAGRTVHEAPIYREGGIGGLIFSETASVAIGTAWGVLDLFEESMRKRKTTVLPLIPMTEHAQYPRFFGEAFQSIDVAQAALLQSDYDYMDWSRRAAAGEIEYGRDLDYRLMLRKQYCAKLAHDAVNLMMRVNGSAGMRGGAMWQRMQRDLTVLMTHNTVQPELAADSFGRMHFGLLPHGVNTDPPAPGPAPPPVR